MPPLLSRRRTKKKENSLVWKCDAMHLIFSCSFQNFYRTILGGVGEQGVQVGQNMPWGKHTPPLSLPCARNTIAQRRNPKSSSQKRADLPHHSSCVQPVEAAETHLSLSLSSHLQPCDELRLITVRQHLLGEGLPKHHPFRWCPTS